MTVLLQKKGILPLKAIPRKSKEVVPVGCDLLHWASLSLHHLVAQHFDHSAFIRLASGSPCSVERNASSNLETVLYATRSFGAVQRISFASQSSVSTSGPAELLLGERIEEENQCQCVLLVLLPNRNFSRVSAKEAMRKEGNLHPL